MKNSKLKGPQVAIETLFYWLENLDNGWTTIPLQQLFFTY